MFHVYANKSIDFQCMLIDLLLFECNLIWLNKAMSVKRVLIRSFSGPYFPAFGLNTEHKNSENEQFSRIITLEVPITLFLEKEFS